MSSAEDDYNDADTNMSSAQSLKKRRIQRACDVCRRKKSDGSQMPGNRCSNCIAYNFTCTYIEAAKKRGPPKGYVENLENRLEKMEKLLSTLCPDADFSKELGGSLDRENWTFDSSFTSNPSSSNRSIAVPQPSGLSLRDLHSISTDAEDDSLVPSDDEFAYQRLSDQLKRIEVNPVHHRFFGKSSGVMLIQRAINLKNEYAGIEPIPPTKKPTLAANSKRPQFWKLHPWEVPVGEEPPFEYNFPEEDLMTSLVDLYFRRLNIFMPLLHRPTFERQLADGLHLVNEGFASTVMLVCANGARYSDDPRIFLERADSPHSCGWKWFEQVQMVRKSLLAAPRLYDLQMYCLCVFFLQGSSAPQACWTMVGIGARLAQDVGAHRRRVYSAAPTVEEELWKRAFWVLVSLDRSISSALGRPCAIQDEDFDVDLPLECDDEYWANPGLEKAFKQPADKPSVVSYFNCFLRLNQILAFALRTIYSINKSKILLGFVGHQWEQHIVAELDSALNKWIDSVPDHLRWDPSREDRTFFEQSACLYINYYHIQIIIHRPFIPAPSKPSPLSFPSLAICTNAARSCSHIIDIQRKRSGVPLPHLHMSIFTAAIVLLLNIWGGKRSGLAMDPNKEMADVHKCMGMFKATENRWHSAGRLWDVLCELASVGDLPLPQSSPLPNKRERDEDEPASNSSPVDITLSSASSSPHSGDQRTIAGSRRVPKDAMRTQEPQAPANQQAQPRQQQLQHTHHQAQRHHQQQVQPTFPSQIATYPLPMYSNELGRLPLHGQVGFDPNFGTDWYALGFSPQSANPGVRAEVQGQGQQQQHAPFPMDQMFYPSSFASGHSTEVSSVDPHAQGHGSVFYGESSAGEMSEMTVAGSGTVGQSAVENMDSDTMAMWSNAPTGFELDDWGTYVTNVIGVIPPNES